MIPEPDGNPTEDLIIPGDFSGGRSGRRLVSGPDQPLKKREKRRSQRKFSLRR
jgi:hypothetical protein